MTRSTDVDRFPAAATYNAAAEYYDEPALGFWHRHGEAMVLMLSPHSGASVLDTGCGTGASALPAAVAVGQDGQVTGIDIAPEILARAAAKARALSLANTHFEVRDMANSGFPDESFDVVISAFSIFFADDMESQVRELWRMVRPGGQLGIVSWAKSAFEPLGSTFREELSDITGELQAERWPWERLNNPNALRHLLEDAGAVSPQVKVVEDIQPLPIVDEWWTVVLGSGFRADVERLATTHRQELHARFLERVSRMATRSIETSALHAIAHKPS